MSFFKKLGETMKETASSIGSKSMDMVETGKLKLQKSQLEGDMKDKKTEIGHLIYLAQKENNIPDSDALKNLFAAVGELENQIMSIDEKLKKETVAETHEPAAEEKAPVVLDTPVASTVPCSKCGQELPLGAKFCNNCGEQQ